MAHAEKVKDPSMEQTAAGLSTVRGIDTKLNFTDAEISVLRELALKVAELAAHPQEAEKAALWTAHNDLEETRPLIFADPENGWNEIITQDQMLCSDPLARVWEMHLRKEIFWGTEMGDDKVIENYFNVPWSYDDTGWGLHEEKIGGEDGGSYTWKTPIEEYERDFENLRFPEIRLDTEESDKTLEYAQQIFGDILKVRRKGIWWWTLGMTWDFINLRGLENLMMDLYLNPEWVHRLMAFLRDGTLKKLDYLESHGLLSLNTEGSYVGSGGFGWTKELPGAEFNPDQVRCQDMWGFAESQETVGIDPAMFNEFILPYQLPILDRFGLNCYGCCEPIDKRWDYVKTIPRLRRVSISPWADRDASRELLGGEYIISMKPNPADLAQPRMDVEGVRASIREELKAVKGGVVEVLMKDNHTLGHNPGNITAWCKIVREEIDRLW
ncbi:MAG: hypothetical protein PQJ58_17800 [Spirochaetales bacterium]|nr:hypothetical protein [Spirochaetales bacterium]